MIYKETGALAMSVNFKPNQPVRVENVLVHLSTLATAAVNLTIQKISTSGYYDTVLLTQAMSSVSDVCFYPEQPVQLNVSEKLQVAWVNDASSYKRWGVEIQYSRGI